MAARAKVAVLRTQPDTVLDDCQRLFELASQGEPRLRALASEHTLGPALPAVSAPRPPVP